MKIHGSPYQRSGIPDLLVIIKGEAYFFEIKTSDKDKPSKIQIYCIQQIRKAGGFASVVTSWDEVENFLPT